MTDSGYKYLDNRKIAAMTELRIPARMQGAIIRYVEDGIPPGNFLGAVIDNDLKEAFARADDENASLIGNYIKWLYNYAPAKCWGRENSQPTWRKLLHQIAMDVGQKANCNNPVRGDHGAGYSIKPHPDGGGGKVPICRKCGEVLEL